MACLLSLRHQGHRKIDSDSERRRIIASLMGLRLESLERFERCNHLDGLNQLQDVSAVNSLTANKDDRPEPRCSLLTWPRRTTFERFDLEWTGEHFRQAAVRSDHPRNRRDFPFLYCSRRCKQ